MPIAIPDLLRRRRRRVGREIAQVMSADLERSGLFQPIDRQGLRRQGCVDADPAALRRLARSSTPRRSSPASAEVQPDGRLAVEFRLWDVFAEQQLTGLAYTTTQQNWRRIAHIVADAIYKRITGEDGYFDTRIVYISESGPLNHRIKRLAIMDQDGANNRFLTDGRTLVLTPRFSPTAQEITYMAYAGNRPRVYLFNIDTGQQEVLGDFPGMTFAPRFSPDGNKVIMSLAVGGDTHIYTLDLQTRHAVRLTDDPGDRHLALLLARRHPDRVQFRPRRHAAALCDERRRQRHPPHQLRQRQIRHAGVVAARRSHRLHQNRRRPVLYRRDASRWLGRAAADQGFLVEGPTWAPNGRVLMYFRQPPSDARAGRFEPSLYHRSDRL